jgi:hypothetical protein
MYSQDFLIYLQGVVQEEAGVVRVGLAEDHGRGRHGRRSLAGDVRARVLPVDLVRLARRGHVLRPLPAVVVRVAVAHLQARTKLSTLQIDQFWRETHTHAMCDALDIVY